MGAMYPTSPAARNSRGVLFWFLQTVQKLFTLNVPAHMSAADFQSDLHVFFAKEVAAHFHITHAQVVILARILHVKRQYGVWYFTQTDIQKMHLLLTGKFTLDEGGDTLAKP